VVFKPAEMVPLSAHNLVEAILDAGFPPEIINLVHGSGKEVGTRIVTHPDIPVISFTGSSAVGRSHWPRRKRACLKRVSMELGGKNASDCHERRRSRSRRGVRHLGRLRHDRTALHRDVARDLRRRHSRCFSSRSMSRPRRN
jgi:hypothetical protein